MKRPEEIRILVGCEFSGIAAAMADQWGDYVLGAQIQEAA